MKIINSTWLHKLGMAMSIALALGSGAFGQKLGNLGLIQRENAEKLREYSWKSRTEIGKGRETKVVRLDQVRYATDGTLQTTQLSLTAPELPTGGIRGMIAKKKKEEFGKLVDGLTNLARSYGKIPPDKMKQFIENASIMPESTATGRCVRLSGTDVLQPGDSVTIWIDAALGQQRKVEVKTAFQGRAVRIVSEFKEIPGGPAYLARALVEYPDEEVIITTDNFDHVKEPTAGGAGKQ